MRQRSLSWNRDSTVVNIGEWHANLENPVILIAALARIDALGIAFTPKFLLKEAVRTMFARLEDLEQETGYINEPRDARGLFWIAKPARRVLDSQMVAITDYFAAIGMPDDPKHHATTLGSLRRRTFGLQLQAIGSRKRYVDIAELIYHLPPDDEHKWAVDELRNKCGIAELSQDQRWSINSADRARLRNSKPGPKPKELRLGDFLTAAQWKDRDKSLAKQLEQASRNKYSRIPSVKSIPITKSDAVNLAEDNQPDFKLVPAMPESPNHQADSMRHLVATLNRINNRTSEFGGRIQQVYETILGDRDRVEFGEFYLRRRSWLELAEAKECGINDAPIGCFRSIPERSVAIAC